MKIAIDAYEANVLQRVGSSQVAFNLIKTIELVDKKNEYVVFIPENPLPDLPKERAGFKYKKIGPKRLWTYIALPIALNSSKFDLFFSPSHYIPRFSKTKKIATIFDLSFLHFPEMFEKGDFWKLKNWTKFSALNSDHIITISNFSKEGIIKEYRIDKSKITVAYPGYDKEIFNQAAVSAAKIDKVKKKYKISGTYIIYIGTIQPRKNLTRLIEAFSRIILSDSEGSINRSLQLVIVGKSKGEGKEGWKYKEVLEAPSKFGIEDRVIFTGFIPTEDLVQITAGAVVSVTPSLWEGFGIPVIEAMALGIPAIVSNVSSLPEVVGDAGLLVDPYSVDQIEQAIRTVVSDRNLREKYSKAAIEQAKKFSWEAMAETVLKTFEKVGLVGI